MKELFQQLIDNIPDYKEFLTLEEMEASSRRLVERHPDIASLFPVGTTKEGRTITCLKIDGGSKNALMFGCPHPNEPIGTMLLEYFTEQLVQNEALRRELDYTWYIVKAWDADGLKKNERWLKGPYDIATYSRYFFRPAGHQQVDWTFPIDYKEYHFHAPIPETQAMMKLIDDIKPHFIYSLHNAGFGGVYWYISSELSALYPAMYAAAERVRVPLALGEPEVPFCETLAPAVYRSLGTEQHYDYLEQYGAKDIPSILHYGTCSESYARERYGSFTLLTELPYFYDDRIMDMSESDMIRRDCVLASIERSEQSDARIKGYMSRVSHLIRPENQFLIALEAFTKGSQNDSMRTMALTEPDYQRKAKVSEYFDSMVLSRFYNLLSLGLVIGMCEHEIETAPLTPAQKTELEALIAEVEAVHQREVESVSADLNYTAIPIRKLVSIQLECGLLVADYLKDKPRLPVKQAVDAKLRRFLEMPTERSPVWLDDATIAYIRHDSLGDHIWSLTVKNGVRRCLTDRQVRTFAIKSHLPSRSLCFGQDMSGSECEQIHLLSADGVLTTVTDAPDVRHLISGVTPDGSVVAYAANKRTPQTFDIWTKNLHTGEETLVQEFDDNYNWPSDAGMSPDGRYVLYNKLRSASDNALWMTDLSTGVSHRIPKDCQRVSAETEPVWRSDSAGFYLLSDRDSDFVRVWYYDLARETMTLAYSYDWDAERLAISSDDKYLAVFVNEAGYTTLHVYDLDAQREVELPGLPKGVLSYYQQPSWSPTGHRLLFAGESGTSPLGVWLLDVDRGIVVRLSEDQVAPEDKALLVEPELRSYRSFDGLEVPYWLYVPRGKTASQLPILIEIHGGPEGQEVPSFDPFIQYLVSEGICVVAPNVRGSSGYGKVYVHLDDVEKRLDSVRDIESLAHHLVESGLGDAKRLAVSGTSYGGFMTLSCAARYPHLWACAVDTVGMYDLVTFLENTAEYRRPHRESEYGSLAHHRDILRAVSPVTKIKDITAPMMIVQGRNDPRVPVTEAEQAVAALRALGRTVEYLCYDDEGHGIVKLHNRLDCYPKVAAFLKKYLF